MRRAVIALIFFLAACSATGGKKLDSSQVNQFQPGVTTSDQVAAALGQPSGTETKSDGTKSLIYSYMQLTVHGATFIPFVNLFAGGADAKVQKVTFNFDKSGVLKDYATTESQACNNNGAFGHASAENCDKPQ